MRKSIKNKEKTENVDIFARRRTLHEKFVYYPFVLSTLSTFADSPGLNLG